MLFLFSSVYKNRVVAPCTDVKARNLASKNTQSEQQIPPQTQLSPAHYNTTAHHPNGLIILRPRNAACGLSVPVFRTVVPTWQRLQQPSSVHGPGARDSPAPSTPFGARFGAKPPPPSRQDHPTRLAGRLPLLLPQLQNPHQRAHTQRRERQSPTGSLSPDPKASGHRRRWRRSADSSWTRRRRGWRTSSSSSSSGESGRRLRRSHF